jgi:integrase
MLPPQLVERPSITTVAGYFHEGRKRLDKAMAARPDLPCWEALVELHRRGGPIRGKSARKYLHEDLRALKFCLRVAGRRELFEEMSLALRLAIDGRRGRPAKYGAGKKAKDISEELAIAAFNELKRNALQNKYMTDVLVALFVLVASHSGLRPVELIGAKLFGTTLVLQNAKRRRGLSLTRSQDMSHLPEDVLIAVGLIIALLPTFSSRAHYKAWAKDLAEALARACKRAKIKRLSLYGFRDVALATWKKAGLSGPEIAALAGHVSERSAQHYASAKHGHDRKNVVRAVGLESKLEDPGVTGPAAAPHPEPPALSVWEDPPQPAPSRKAEHPVLAPNAVRRHFERLADAADPGKRDLKRLPGEAEECHDPDPPEAT